MRKLVLLCGTLAAMVLISSADSPAQARDFGFHISGPGYHVDLGRPHARTAYYGSYYGGHGGNGRYYDSGYGGGSAWHDTSHYDYHPGEYTRHRNHYHYVPGHYDYHDDGHWDHGW